jgi:hypothetical protein
VAQPQPRTTLRFRRSQRTHSSLTLSAGCSTTPARATAPESARTSWFPTGRGWRWSRGRW